LDQLIVENIYGHQKRLLWLLKHLQQREQVVELGCGTGYMIARPLALSGYRVLGIDLDQASIEYGKTILASEGLPTTILQTVNLADLEFRPDVVIASEVLEHIPTPQLDEIIELIRAKLAPGGKLLVTVPNGYGWFELESFLWFKVGIGLLLEKLQLARIIRRLKHILVGGHDYPYPSTIADSPHVQHFTYHSIQRLLRDHHFVIEETTGSVLFAGPFSNLFFTGFKPLMRLNNWLGSRFPQRAAGFYLACRAAQPPAE
jgi:SAM-dependent methyltransferase